MINCKPGDVLLINGTTYTVRTNEQGAVFLEARTGAGVGHGGASGQPGGAGADGVPVGTVGGQPIYAVGIKKEF